jgi:alpha-beta hydrolase superfamily lysophospholipase
MLRILCEALLDQDEHDMLTHMQDKKDIQAEMGAMGLSSLRAATGGCPYEKGESIKRYLVYYGLGFADVEHRIGWFESGGLRLAGQVWKPKIKDQRLKIKIKESPEAMDHSIDSSVAPRNDRESLVVVVHGYMNHTGQMRHLIGGLLDAGFAVGALDLPGHGLSEGKPAAGTVEQYARAVSDFAALVKAMGFGRLYFVGFSTGCAAGVEAILGGKGDVFERVVLVSPLVRWQGYKASKITYKLYRPFMDKIKRVPQRNSSDEEFLYFNRHKDTLHCKYVSLDWVESMFAWNEKIVRAVGSEKPVLILQGDRDTTVDWRYNVRLLRDKFPAANVEMIPGARHELLNEAPELRDKVIGRTIEYLKRK